MTVCETVVDVVVVGVVETAVGIAFVVDIDVAAVSHGVEQFTLHSG